MELTKQQQAAVRMQLIECASTRPNDIKAFYDKHLLYVNGCSILASDAPRNVAMLFRGKLRHYDSSIVPFILADKDPYGERTCGLANCLNPDHVI